MNSLINKYKQFDYLYFAFIILSCISMPLKSNINSICLIVLSFIFLFKHKVSIYIQKIVRDKVVVAFTFFYGLHLLSYFNSINGSLALKDIILKCPLLLMPIVIKGFEWNKKRVLIVLLSYALMMFLLSVYCFSITYYQSYSSALFDFAMLKEADWAYFSYILPRPIDFHAPYFALFNSVAILFLVYYIISEFQYLNKIISIVLLIINFFLIVFLILLASRTALFATILVIMIFLLYNLYIRGYLKYLVLLVIFMFAFLIGIVTYVPYLKGKIESKSGVSTRTIIWKASITIIENNLLIGVGNGDVKECLRKAYKQLNFEEGVSNMYNAHNQYLQTTIALGIIGLFSLMLCFLVLFYDALAFNNVTSLMFIVVFMICCVTESLLSRHHGVILFSFFSSLFTSFSRNFSNKLL